MGRFCAILYPFVEDIQKRRTKMQTFFVEAVLGGLDTRPRENSAGRGYQAVTGEDALRLAQQDVRFLERFPEVSRPNQLDWIVSTGDNPCVIKVSADN